MKNIFLLIISLPFLASCQNTEAKKDNVNYTDIEKFTKNTNAKAYKKQLENDSISLQTEEENNATEYVKNDRETADGKTFYWEQTNIASNYREQNVAHLHQIKLRAMQFITYKNQLVGITGSSMYSDSVDIKNTIDYLTKKYGKPVDVMEGFYKKSKIGSGYLQYYWQNGEKLIGISYKHDEGDFLTDEDFNNNKATMFPVYEIYMFNRDMINQLKKENITLEDLFNGTTTAMDNMNLGNMITHLKMEEWRKIPE
ncbi:MAG: hypothetical protein BGO86_15955 [Chryseobacterium sp. 36-9]|nr:MAG: hypothetical protein BGO86_15955 [Chryseobacterium sp. 36-9]